MACALVRCMGDTGFGDKSSTKQLVLGGHQSHWENVHQTERKRKQYQERGEAVVGRGAFVCPWDVLTGEFSKKEISFLQSHTYYAVALKEP